MCFTMCSPSNPGLSPAPSQSSCYTAKCCKTRCQSRSAFSRFFFPSKIHCIGLVRTHLGFFCLIQKFLPEYSLKSYHTALPGKIHSWVSKSNATYSNYDSSPMYWYVLFTFWEKFNSNLDHIVFICLYYLTSEISSNKCMFLYTLKLFKYLDIVIVPL